MASHKTVQFVHVRNLRRSADTVIMHPNLFKKLLASIEPEQLRTIVTKPPVARIENVEYKGLLFNKFNLFTSEEIAKFDDLDEDMMIVDHLCDGALGKYQHSTGEIPTLHLTVDLEKKGKMMSPVRIHLVEEE